MPQIANIDENAVLQAKQQLGIVGAAPALTGAVARAMRVAPIDLSVLITGESGSGKEFFPKIIHRYSARKHAKYIAVNCGAIPEGTIDSELFGHEKGAFTGALASRKGYFEEADGGTIFLDEVAELPLTTQARLLRVLESGEFIKVGSSQVQRTNIRVVAATNVDMVRAVAEGRFREDLYYRLSTVQITIPPLRERGSDIVLLARKFAADFAERYRMPAITLSDGARALLQRYRWPGNVRQLKNVVEQAALFEAGSELSAEAMSRYLPAGSAVMSPAVTASDTHSYEREREMLLGMIMRLQADLRDLRDRVDTTSPADPPLRRRAAEAAPCDDFVEVAPEPARLPVKVDEVAHIDLSVPPTASLNDTERHAIVNALERNLGRRKAAAAELGISERTLYRKIKEYGLE